MEIQFQSVISDRKIIRWELNHFPILMEMAKLKGPLKKKKNSYSSPLLDITPIDEIEFEAGMRIGIPSVWKLVVQTHRVPGEEKASLGLSIHLIHSEGQTKEKDGIHAKFKTTFSTPSSTTSLLKEPQSWDTGLWDWGPEGQRHFTLGSVPIPNQIEVINVGITMEMFAKDPAMPKLRKIEEDFGKWFDSSEYADFTVKVPDESFKVHKGVLFSRSPVFKAMLSSGMEEERSGEVTIPDFTPAVMQHSLRFLYSGFLKDGWEENIDGIYKFADKYFIPDLKQECLKQLPRVLTPENAARIHDRCSKVDFEDGRRIAMDFILNNMEQIIVM